MKSFSSHARIRRQPAGFTLVEVLVVVFVLGLLAAIILSAIQAVRDTSRRITCTANLRQMGIALNAYVASIGSLPHGANAKRGYSVHSMILNHLDLRNIYNSTNFMVHPEDRENRTVRRTVLAVFLCPSDGAISKPSNNYAINMGYGYQLRKQELTGMFVNSPSAPTSLANIPDGASSTALMTESVVGPGDRQVFEPLGSVYYTPTALTMPTEFEQFLGVCQAMTPQPGQKYFSAKGSTWLNSGYGYTYYNHDLLPNQNSCMNKNFVREGAWTASSFHSSGVNVLFADGRVQFLRQTIGLPLWRAIATRAGHEAIGGTGY